MNDNNTGAGRIDESQAMLSTFLVPFTQNNGSLQPASRINRLEERLAKFAGGMTGGYPGRGIWVPPTSHPLYDDIVMPVYILTPNGKEYEEKMLEFAAEIARDFEQEMVMLFMQPVWRLSHNGNKIFNFPIDPLTAREIVVLRQLAAGMSNWEIAMGLVLSVKTVEKHLSNIYAKLDVAGRTQAILWAIQNGIVPKYN